ncbi:hypothetical protein VCR4J2_240024 [Vibrio coralliirubri]|nr:hypothetical protein VCR4J2_240024 [Vibrio coralliirubri]
MIIPSREAMCVNLKVVDRKGDAFYRGNRLRQAKVVNVMLG